MLVAPTPYKEAAAFIAGKPIVSRQVFAKLLPALKGRAFVIAGIEAASVLQNVRDTIAMLPQGGDWETLKATVLEQIDPYFIDPSADAETQTAQRRAAARRAELLLRTHGQQAYMAGLYGVADAQRDVFPFWQYQSLGDGNVRPSHAALDGIVLPASHEFWQTHTPPWDWGCRCEFIPISAETAQEMRDADKDLPIEKKRVIEGDMLTKLENERSLWRPRNLATGEGDPVPYNVQSPKEAGKEGAFEWNPADLKLTPEQLKDRYEPEVWSQFEAWAKTAEIEPGQSVWAWMNGGETEVDAKPENAAQYAGLRFEDWEEAKKWADANTHPSKLKLSKQQLRSLKEYQGGDYQSINIGLRTDSLALEDMGHVMNIQAAMTQQLPQEMKLFRGLAHQVFEGVTEGSEFTDKAFVSTSMAENGVLLKATAVMEISAPAGAKGIYLDELAGKKFKGEVEWLLPTNSRFRIDRIEEKDGIKRIFATLL